MICVHHGSVKYDPSKFKKIINSEFVKPYGGLWSSPVNSKCSWVKWCLENYPERYAPSFFKFEVKGNIYKISDVEDILALPLVDTMRSTTIDFEKCVDLQIDAIHLTERGVYSTQFSSPNLYGWDCETVLVLNPKVIHEIV